MKDRGFSLIEVLIAIVILSSIVISVFYFYSGSIGNQKKIIEKYKVLRITKEFIDNFQESENSGRYEREGLLLEWQAFPAEDSRKIIRSVGGIDSFLQLKLVHLDIFRKIDKKNLFSANFIYNAFLSVKK